MILMTWAIGERAAREGRAAPCEWPAAETGSCRGHSAPQALQLHPDPQLPALQRPLPQACRPGRGRWGRQRRLEPASRGLCRHQRCRESKARRRHLQRRQPNHAGWHRSQRGRQSYLLRPLRRRLRDQRRLR